MKQIISFRITILVFMILLSCKKEEAVTFENPMQAVLNAKMIVDTIETTSWSFSTEEGHKIYFSKNGLVTQLGCRMASKGRFQVSFWDFDNEILITSAIINVADTAKFIYSNITPVAVTANKRYILSINNTDLNEGIGKKYFLASKKNNPNIYPFTIGNITFEHNQYASSNTPIFPDEDISTNEIFNFSDLTFQPY